MGGMSKKNHYGRSLVVFCLLGLMFCMGIAFEKKINDGILSSPILEGRSRALVQYIELSKAVFDTGDMKMFRRYVEDSYAKRNLLCKGANAEEYVYFWCDWATEVNAMTNSPQANHTTHVRVE